MSPRDPHEPPRQERGEGSDRPPRAAVAPVPLIAIVGAPNAGKSTLFNRLLGRRKALVHREPGMTRDVNEERWDLGGRPVVLADTGGLLHAQEPGLVQEVRRQVLGVCSRASLLIFVVDGRRGLTPLDEELARLLRSTGRPILVAVNKLDAPGKEEALPEFHRLGFDAPLPISAEHGHGMEELRDALESALATLAPLGPAAAGAEEVRIAIVGRPNVGKSSLLNALLGEDRAIVSAMPGTTRDSIDCEILRGERVYRVIDTAGIRRGGRVSEWPEALSAMTAGRSLQRADVVLLIMDSTEAPTNQDLHVAGLAQQAGRPFMVLLNKWDLMDGPAPDIDRLLETVRGRLRFATHAPMLTISARTGLRVQNILPLVDRIHQQAQRRLGTGRLNAWLTRAVAAHPPPASRGRAVRLYYAAQTSTNPPRLAVFTSAGSRLHFSYKRYLENSLRSAFGLDLTPVVIDYRERPRRTRPPGGKARKPRR